MALKDKFAELLNSALPIFNRIKFGNIIQQIQDDVAALAGSSAEVVLNSSTGDQDSIPSGTSEKVYITCIGASPVILGIAAREQLTQVTLVRASSSPMTIKNVASATLGDNIALPGGEDILIAARESATFIYVETVGWMLVSIAQKPTETKFVFKPSATATEQNVYKTWAELYAAFLQKQGEGRRVIEIDDGGTGGGVTIPTGTYAGLFDDVTIRGVGIDKSNPWSRTVVSFEQNMIVTGAVRGLRFENIDLYNDQDTQCVADIDANEPAAGDVHLDNFAYHKGTTYGLFGLHGSNGPLMRIYLGKRIDIQGKLAMFLDDSGGLIRVYDIPADAIITDAFTTSVGNTGGNSLAFYFTTPTAAPDGNVSLTQVNFGAGDVEKNYNTYFAPLQSGNPAGTVIQFAGVSAPNGYLACDGASLLRADYVDLFAAIGTTHGAADGTHFNVPDMRGLFVRGAGSHGTMTKAAGGAFNGGSVGATSNDSMQGHYHAHTPNSPLMTLPGGSSFIGSGGFTVDYSGSVTSPKTDGTNGTPRTGNETKPASISLLYCIKV